VILEIVTSHGSSQPAEALETSACIQSIRQNVKELRGRAANTESSKLHNKKEALVLLCDILYLMTYDDQDGWTEALPLIEVRFVLCVPFLILNRAALMVILGIIHHKATE
jgi:hypothetical protein